MSIDWRIYYDDGRTFSSDDGQVEDAPAWGVQVIAEPDGEVGRRMHSRADYYIWLGQRWVSTDFVGLIDHLTNVIRTIKIGRQTSREKFRSALQKATEDPDFHRKSAWLREESRE